MKRLIVACRFIPRLSWHGSKLQKKHVIQACRDRWSGEMELQVWWGATVSRIWKPIWPGFVLYQLVLLIITENGASRCHFGKYSSWHQSCPYRKPRTLCLQCDLTLSSKVFFFLFKLCPVLGYSVFLCFNISQ